MNAGGIERAGDLWQRPRSLLPLGTAETVASTRESSLKVSLFMGRPACRVRLLTGGGKNRPSAWPFPAVVAHRRKMAPGSSWKRPALGQVQDGSFKA